MEIKALTADDWAAAWRILEPVLRAGETYPYPQDITEEEARRAWLDVPEATFLAVDEESEGVGTYYLRPNQPGLGSHVCNCGYVVGQNARGKGVASKMCEHSQQEAIARGFKAMQYNLVVSTNEVAVRLWTKQGFDRIGTLRRAFHHPRLGYVDALVMYKWLDV